MKLTGFMDARIFESQLRAMAKDVRKEVRRDLRACAELTAQKARDYAPTRTFYMRDHITVRQSPYGRGRIGNDLMFEVNVKAPYAGFVDAGANQPSKNVAWFRRAVRDTRAQNNETVKNAIRKGLQSQVSGGGLTINGKNLGFLDAVELG